MTRLNSHVTIHILKPIGLPWWLSGKESACQHRRHGFDSWSGKIPQAAEPAHRSLRTGALEPQPLSLRAGAREPQPLSLRAAARETRLLSLHTGAREPQPLSLRAAARETWPLSPWAAATKASVPVSLQQEKPPRWEATTPLESGPARRS